MPEIRCTAPRARADGRFGRAVLTGTLIGALLAGCGGGDARPVPTLGPPAPPTGASPGTPPSVDSGIRAFDLASARWYEYASRRTVTMVAGSAEVPLVTLDDGVLDRTGEFQLFGLPAYGDLDGDGDGDALVPTGVQYGNGTVDRHYAWLWDGGTARQVRRPVFQGGDCDDQLDRADPVDGGFRLTVRVKDPDAACADGARIRAPSYVVTVRDGYPVRLVPRLSAPEWCAPEVHVRQLTPGSAVRPRVAPDPAAPLLDGPVAYSRIAVRKYGRAERDRTGRLWRLALLVRPDGDTDCGWVPSALSR